jgi:hypothetical protein
MTTRKETEMTINFAKDRVQATIDRLTTSQTERGAEINALMKTLTEDYKVPTFLVHDFYQTALQQGSEIQQLVSARFEMHDIVRKEALQAEKKVSGIRKLFRQ